MSIYKTIALLGAGYILRDRIGSNQNYRPRYRDPNSLSGHITQILNDKLDLLFYGYCKWRPAMRNNIEYNRDRPNYNNYFYPVRSPRKQDTDDITFDTMDDAYDVLNKLTDIIETYGHATLSDFYETSGIPRSDTYENQRYGWDDLSDAEFVEKADGRWYISLPETEFFG